MKKREKRNPPKKSERPKPPVQVGHLVWRHLINNKLPKTLLAKETNRSLTTVMRQLRKPSMQVAELFEFCNVLKHDFFSTLSQHLPPEFTGRPDYMAQLAAQEQTIQQLQAEVNRLQQENQKLNDRVDLLLRKL